MSLPGVSPSRLLPTPSLKVPMRLIGLAVVHRPHAANCLVPALNASSTRWKTWSRLRWPSVRADRALRLVTKLPGNLHRLTSEHQPGRLEQDLVLS